MQIDRELHAKRNFVADFVYDGRAAYPQNGKVAISTLPLGDLSLTRWKARG